MVTKLDKPLRREISIDGKPFVVTLSAEGFKLVGKGRRKGLDMSWAALVSGDAALATALQASLQANLEPAKGKKKAAKRR
jgi:hypothetical protein